MRESNSGRKSGGFSGGSSYKSGSGGSRGGFSRPQSGGFGGGDRGGRPSTGFRGGRDSRDSQGRSEDRPMYKATCSDCGKPCEVPFRPNGSKPVLCSNCYAQEQGGGNDRSFAPRNNSYESRSSAFEAGAEKKMFKATCKECGSPCEVPFRPVPGKDVLCDNCFKGNSPAKSKPGSDTKEQIAELNAKLDQILALLKPADKTVKSVVAKVLADKDAVVEAVSANAKDVAKKVSKATKKIIDEAIDGAVEAIEEAVKPKKVAKPKGAKPVKK